MAEDRGWTVIYVLTVTAWCVIKRNKLSIPLHKIDQVQSRINYLWGESQVVSINNHPYWYRTAGGNCASSIFLFSVTTRDYNKSEISIIQRLSWINNGGRVYLFSGYPRDINNKAIIRQQHKKLSLLINIYPCKVHRCRKSKIIYFKL